MLLFPEFGILDSIEQSLIVILVIASYFEVWIMLICQILFLTENIQTIIPVLGWTSILFLWFMVNLKGTNCLNIKRKHFNSFQSKVNWKIIKKVFLTEKTYSLIFNIQYHEYPHIKKISYFLICIAGLKPYNMQHSNFKGKSNYT